MAVLLVALVVAVSPSTAQALTVGSPVALGSLTGAATVSHATSVNDLGDVVGWSLTASGHKHAFFLGHGTTTMVDLGTLGGSDSSATSVNVFDEVVGSSQLAGDTTTHAFLWTSATGMTDEGTLGGTNSIAYSVDDCHDLAGTSQIAGDSAYHAFFVPGPCQFPYVGMTDIGVRPGGTNSVAYKTGPGGIYGSSDVGGTEPCSYHPADTCNITHAASFDFHIPGFPEQVVDLGALPGGRSSVAYGSSADTIFGTSEVSSTSDASHAVSWHNSNTPKDLGTLPGDIHAAALGINDADQIVGTSDDQTTSCGACDSEGGAFLYDPSTDSMTALTGFHAAANDINNNGEIVGKQNTVISPGIELPGAVRWQQESVIDGCGIVPSPTPADHTSCAGDDLSGADLTHLDLSYADLHGANLAGADLTNTIITAANFSGTVLAVSDRTYPADGPSGRTVGWTKPLGYLGGPTGVTGVSLRPCTPPPGSLFPVGVTVAGCPIRDTATNTVAPGNFTVTILPVVQPGSGTVTAPTSGTADLHIAVTLNAPSPTSVTVAWTTLHLAGSPTLLGIPQAPTTDYASSSGTVTFAAGQTTADVVVPVSADTATPGPEFVVVSFRNPIGAFMGGFYGLSFGIIDPAP